MCSSCELKSQYGHFFTHHGKWTYNVSGGSVFIACDILAGLIWTGTLATLGYSIGQRAVDIVNSVSHYSLYITVALVALVIAKQVRGARRPAV